MSTSQESRPVHYAREDDRGTRHFLHVVPQGEVTVDHTPDPQLATCGTCIEALAQEGLR